MTAVRVTGLQAAQVALAALLAAWQAQLSPREYGVLIDLAGRIVEAERQRAGRWAA